MQEAVQPIPENESVHISGSQRSNIPQTRIIRQFALFLKDCMIAQIECTNCTIGMKRETRMIARKSTTISPAIHGHILSLFRTCNST